MKNLLLILSLVFALPALSETDIQWYSVGGLALYSEDFDASVGDGVGANFGIGAQINKTFGIEIFADRSPPIEPEDLWDEFSKVFDTSAVTEYDIKIAGNLSFTVAGTLTFPMSDRLSGIVKGGFTSISYNLERFDVTQREYIPGSFRTQDVTYDLAAEADDSEDGTFISGGLLFQVNEKNLIELSVSQTRGEEGNATAFKGAWRYNF